MERQGIILAALLRKYYLTHIESTSVQLIYHTIYTLSKAVSSITNDHDTYLFARILNSLYGKCKSPRRPRTLLRKWLLKRAHINDLDVFIALRIHDTEKLVRDMCTRFILIQTYQKRSNRVSSKLDYYDQNVLGSTECLQCKSEWMHRRKPPRSDTHVCFTCSLCTKKLCQSHFSPLSDSGKLQTMQYDNNFKKIKCQYCPSILWLCSTCVSIFTCGSCGNHVHRCRTCVSIGKRCNTCQTIELWCDKCKENPRTCIPCKYSYD